MSHLPGNPGSFCDARPLASTVYSELTTCSMQQAIVNLARYTSITRKTLLSASLPPGLPRWVVLIINPSDGCQIRAVQVRQGGGQQSPVYEDLIKAEEAAKAARKGLWTTDADTIQAAVRPPPAPDASDASALIARHGKGKPLPAIVEQVLSGSLLRVTLPDEGGVQTLVFVCGVQAPSLGRKAPEPATNGVAANGAAAAPAGGFSSAVAAGINTTGERLL